MKILVIKSSINQEESQTNHLIQHYLDARKTKGYQDDIVEHNLAVKPVPELDNVRFHALRGADITRDDIKETVQLSDQLINELKNSDLLILGAPIYNLNVPTQLKNWFDLVVRVKHTFCYTETYPLGLVDNVQSLVFSSRGGIHLGQETDIVTPYLKSVLGLIGITKVNFVYAEGLDIKPEGFNAGIANAHQQIEQYVDSIN